MLGRFFRQRSKMLAVRSIHTTVELPPLPWEIHELEPVLSGYMIDYHYTRHHHTYWTNLTTLLRQQAHAKEKGDYETLVRIAPDIAFNGGGHLNHSFYWHSLAPTTKGGGERPSESSAFNNEVKQAWGSVDHLIADFTKQTAAIKGSGWGWLCWNKAAHKLQYAQTKDQDIIHEGTGLVPLLNIDVWEHAYYLDYKNARPNYLNEIWKVVNWHKVEHRFNKAVARPK